ncbi:helix-turn-helix transcriptional regulator (plasmid) [Rhizobium grahamii]|uniref:Helix-turn-helix transcriptional regulator n=1 Tax=Rhizobium grahamii TaxID=1120045 RepID=A0A5Q0CA68_9HYPH|nr:MULTISPECIES: helix-turn-helix transcriptional regulator [Rhizobium]QFY62786.1 helix-turn-helix transcriptional regulator [Rhizobium grahamii]QRM52468.1 helix-turn-helix transcriptional regulator [Rhizobium sp. BG6]
MPRILGSAFSQVDREVGARIRARRKILGLSQTMLAQELGVTYQQVQKYENGKNRIGSSSLHTIAQALGTTPSVLFGQIGVEDPGGTLEFHALHEFVGSAEGIALNRAFGKIRDEKVRRAVIALIASLSASRREPQ